MDIHRLRDLLLQRDEPGKQDIADLKELTDEYPFFQAAQFLLTKAYKLSHDTAYDKQLSKTAVYASDRLMLKNYLEKEKDNPLVVANENPFIEIPVAENPFIENEHTPQEIQKSEHLPVTNEEELKPHYSPDEFSKPSVFGGLESLPVDTSKEDPHDIIKRRLEELFGKKENTSEETDSILIEKEIEPDLSNQVIEPESEKQPEIIEEIQTAFFEEISSINENISEIPPMPEQIIEPDQAAIAYAMEDSILASIEEMPVIAPIVISKPVAIEKKHEVEFSFIEWLQKISGERYNGYETVKADDESNETIIHVEGEITESTPSKIIDRFIETMPRISPVKAEFFNPVVQAKRSIEEDENLVSETLAAIYAEQNLHEKALRAYEKLSLYYPEKRHFFAARISEIQVKINRGE